MEFSLVCWGDTQVEGKVVFLNWGFLLVLLFFDLAEVLISLLNILKNSELPFLRK